MRFQRPSGAPPEIKVPVAVRIKPTKKLAAGMEILVATETATAAEGTTTAVIRGETEIAGPEMKAPW